MPTSQSDKAVTFRALHQGPRAFVIANAIVLFVIGHLVMVIRSARA